MREQRGQRRLVVQAVDTREPIAQGHEARRLDTRLVHERTIEVRELARLDAFDHVAQLLLGGLV
jgi:hypothetical protein